MYRVHITRFVFKMSHFKGEDNPIDTTFKIRLGLKKKCKNDEIYIPLSVNI